MSNKLSVKNKEDIPQVIKDIVKTHGNGILRTILKELLNEYNHELLIDIIKNITGEESKERQNFFIIGIEVYKYKYDNDCSMKSARAAIGEKTGIKDSTIRNHLDHFRQKIKKDIAKLEYYNNNLQGVEEFITDFIKRLNDKYSIKNVAGDTEYIEPKAKKREYREAYYYFINKMNVPF